MPNKITVKLPNPEGVAAGGTATFRIPVGRRIHSLLLKYAYNVTTQNVADFTEIRLYINGQVVQRFTGTERDKLNQFDGMTASVGWLEIPFDRKKLLTKVGREETALNTGVADDQGRKISSVYMEIDLDSGMTITSTDLQLYARESDALPGGPGTIPYIRRDQRTVGAATTDWQISDLINPGVNAPDKIALNRVHFVPSANAIDNLKIDRNSYTIFDRPDALNRVIQNGGVRVAQAGWYTIDPTELGDGGEPVDLFGMTDYRYRLEVDGAMTATILSEYLGVLTQ